MADLACWVFLGGWRRQRVKAEALDMSLRCDRRCVQLHPRLPHGHRLLYRGMTVDLSQGDVLAVAVNETTALSRSDSLLVLDLRLDVLDRVRALDLEGDGLARQCLDEDLHSCKVLGASGLQAEEGGYAVQPAKRRE